MRVVRGGAWISFHRASTFRAVTGTSRRIGLTASGFAASEKHVKSRPCPKIPHGSADVKAVHSPRVLHLATHGFFTASTEQAETKAPSVATSNLATDPMLASGLYFAGANRTLTGKPWDADLDDGILTAFEASSLNLSNTELVVLSACETGLGVTRNGEGVFGLRRALQEAGAGAVLMSLWKVPDQETEELMKPFYEKFLSGEDKQKALREAQLEMRERVKARRDGDDVPFYWGAFVLVGN
jgi:CHAT domain-containing protein